MRVLCRPLPFLVPALALALAATASPHPNDASIAFQKRDSPDVAAFVYQRDEHGHGHGHHHAQPLLELNETEVRLSHQETPPSYWSIDFEDRNQDESRYPGLMGLHIFFMSCAFFGALPFGECPCPRAMLSY